MRFFFICVLITLRCTYNKSIIPQRRWWLQRNYSVSTHENKINYVKKINEKQNYKQFQNYTRILLLAPIYVHIINLKRLFSGFRRNSLTQRPSRLIFAMIVLFQNFVNRTRRSILFILNTEQSFTIGWIRRTSILIGKNLFAFSGDFLTRFC